MAKPRPPGFVPPPGTAQALPAAGECLHDRYPPCGQGDPDPTRWFPLTHDWGIDPDFPGCGTDGFPRFEEHQLRVHWSPDKKLITNHCKDGKQNFGETAADMGGRCL